MKDRYRRFSFLSDIEGMKNAIGKMRVLFFSKQPDLNRKAINSGSDQDNFSSGRMFVITEALGAGH
jgi:hypothetical protein